MKNFLNKVINADGLETIKTIPDNSVNLICIDPPYNIGKGRENWDNVENYFEWLNDYFIEFERILADNGSFFIFHNDFRTLGQLDNNIDSNTSFVFKNFIVWNKRFDKSIKKGYLDGFVSTDGLYGFQKMSEYILFYQFDLHHKLLERRKDLGISQERITMEILSKNGKRTGWYSNIENGLSYPTERTIKPIQKHLGLTMEDLVPKFRNQKTHHSIWNYDLDHKKIGHITPKPLKLIKNIILHTTDKDDIVLDCFGGSGTLAVACKELNRNFIIIEKEDKYCDIAIKRLDGS